MPARAFPGHNNARGGGGAGKEAIVWSRGLLEENTSAIARARHKVLNFRARNTCTEFQRKLKQAGLDVNVERTSTGRWKDNDLEEGPKELQRTSAYVAYDAKGRRKQKQGDKITHQEQQRVCHNGNRTGSSLIPLVLVAPVEPGSLLDFE
jgi:hypothetical protein